MSLSLISQLEELESKNIFVQYEFMTLGSDEWGFQWAITYLPKEYANEKRRATHLVNKQSFYGAGATYEKAWDTIEEALTEGVKYAKEKLLNLV